MKNRASIFNVTTLYTAVFPTCMNGMHKYCVCVCCLSLTIISHYYADVINLIVLSAHYIVFVVLPNVFITAIWLCLRILLHSPCRLWCLLSWQLIILSQHGIIRAWELLYIKTYATIKLQAFWKKGLTTKFIDKHFFAYILFLYSAQAHWHYNFERKFDEFLLITARKKENYTFSPADFFNR